MLKLKFIACAIIFSLLGVSSASGQVPPITEAQVRAKLDKFGMSEEDFRAELLKKGIDIDQIDLTNPQELLRLQRATESIEAEKLAQLEGTTKEAAERTAEQEKEQAAELAEQEVTNQIQEVASSTAQDVVEKVEAGATVQEALTEGIIDAKEDELPPAIIYGQHIFRNKEIKTYRNTDNIITPDSYVLGIGDKISIALWGYSELDVIEEINKEGYIKPEGMTRINLKGITLGRAKGLLRSRFANYYRFGQGQFLVTIYYPRTINVNIVGEVINPGSFTMPAINTAFNALAAAGGPSDIGSVRNIKIIRPGGKVRELDVYEFLLDPTISQDYYLQDNDVIFVGVSDKLVSIQGPVKRPFIYELKANEELKDLVKYAGGLSPNAYQGNFQVKRFVNDIEKIIDVNYGELVNSANDFNINAGDEVVIGVIPKLYKNFIEITGSVDLPGRYELEAGMTISELVAKGVLSEGSRTDIAYLLRTTDDGILKYNKINIEDAITNVQSPENVTLQPKDKLVILSSKTFTDQYEIAISGAVRKPSTYKYNSGDDLKINDLITLAGGLREDATNFAYVYRKELVGSQEKEYVKIDVKNAFENPDSGDNLILKPNDRVEVFSVYTYTDDFLVRVGGAVRNPGEYEYHPSLTLKDVLTLSGGLKFSASPNRIDIFRMVINKNEATKSIVATVAVDENLEMSSEFKLEPFDQIVVRLAPEFELQQFVTIAGEVKYPGPYGLIDDNEKLTALIKRAGGLTKEAFPTGAMLYRVEDSTGFVILRLDEALKNNKNIHNFILKKGDVITIPKQKDLVAIIGATKVADLYPDTIVQSDKINVAYHQKKRAKWYVDEYAAGVGKKGKRRLITVEYPNGQIKRTKNFLLFKVYPRVVEGAVVKVGVKQPKPPREEGDRKKTDWGQTLANTLSSATAVLTFILLIRNLN
jgi:protein involved in polysaccharide export with SLBB domain